MLKCSSMLTAALVLLSTTSICSSAPDSRSTEELLSAGSRLLLKASSVESPAPTSDSPPGASLPARAASDAEQPAAAADSFKIPAASHERKDFHQLFENCVVGIGVKEERLFLKELEECIFVRSLKKNMKYSYMLEPEKTTSRAIPYPTTDSTHDDDDDLPDDVTETVYDNFGRKFLHLYVPGYGEALISRRERRQLRQREKPTPRPKTSTTTRKTSTAKSDIIVGEDRKRLRAKGLWG